MTFTTQREADGPGQANRIVWLAWAFSGLCCLAAAAPVTAAATASADESGPGHWKPSSAAMATHIEQTQITDRSGPVARFHLKPSGQPELVRLDSPVDASILHFDYVASVQVRASAPGLTLGLLIVLPHQVDPRTGFPLQAVITGDQLNQTDSWQKLNVSVTAKRVEAQLRRLRTELNRSQIDSRDAVIVGAVILCEVFVDESFIDIRRLEAGPPISLPDRLQGVTLQPPGETPAPDLVRQFIPLDVELGSILFDRQPVILRLAPDHHEHVDTLRQLGLNAVWVPDYRAVDRARELKDHELAVIATPPHPEFEPGDYQTVLHALPPLAQQCPSVSAWYTGTRVPHSELAHLLSWSREIRSADRLLQRPQMADVPGLEGAASREIDLVGLGRQVIGRDESFGALRNLLIERQQSAGQLSFPWMWVQTEAASSVAAWRTSAGVSIPVVEPEQILHQVYAVLSAGYKGLGFWKTKTLQIDDPVDRERSLAIELACLEIELLEPFLASGQLEGHLTLQTSSAQNAALRLRDGAPQFIKSALSGSNPRLGAGQSATPETPDAAVIRSDRSVLILATAWDRESQFVPASMYEREVRLVVSASETASAWQVSATGVRSLPREITAGGLALTIPDFDRAAVILISSDPALVARLRQRVNAMSSRAARVASELAALKYVRVLQTMEDLRDCHAVAEGVDQLMSSARDAIDRAEQELAGEDFQEAARFAQRGLRSMREAQSLCWKDAVSELTSPMASPHAIAFSTLPDHWRLMHAINQQTARLSANLLRSGSFDELASIRQNGWECRPSRGSRISSAADVIRDATSGQMLRMVAWKSDDGGSISASHETLPLIVTSPAIPVARGDTMIVTGRVRRGRAVPATGARPVLLYDSELGAESAMRLETSSEWTSFEMIRPIATSTEFRVSLALTDQIEIHADDLQVRKLPAPDRNSRPPVVEAGFPE